MQFDLNIFHTYAGHTTSKYDYMLIRWITSNANFIKLNSYGSVKRISKFQLEWGEFSVTIMAWDLKV